jgi:hypothetical protein
MALAACAQTPTTQQMAEQVNAAPAPLGPQPANSDANGPQLTAAEIRSVMVGNTGLGTRTGTKAEWGMYVAPDDRLLGKGVSGGDTGQWLITEDGRFCMRWRVDWDGQEICQTVHRASPTAIRLTNLNQVEVLTFWPGNRS